GPHPEPDPGTVPEPRRTEASSRLGRPWTCDDSLVTMTERLPLRRPSRGRLVGGVCAGLAAHLGIPVMLVRVALILLLPLAGSGAVLYVWFWVTVPAGDP